MCRGNDKGDRENIASFLYLNSENFITYPMLQIGSESGETVPDPTLPRGKC